MERGGTSRSLDALVLRIRELEEQNRDLVSTRNEVSAELLFSQERVRVLENEKRSLLSELERKRADEKSIESEVESLGKVVVERTLESSQLQEQLQNALQKSQRQDELERKVQGLAQDKEEIEEQLAHLRSLNRRLETNLRAYEEENQRLKGELGMAQEESDQKSAKLHAYERKVETLEGQIRETTDDVDTLKAIPFRRWGIGAESALPVSMWRDGLMREADRLGQSLAETEKRNKELMVTLQDVSEENALLRKSVGDTLDEILGQYEKETKLRERRIREVETECQALRRRLETESLLSSSKDNAIKELRLTIETNRREIMRWEERFDELRNSCRLIQGDLDVTCCDFERRLGSLQILSESLLQKIPSILGVDGKESEAREFLTHFKTEVTQAMQKKMMEQDQYWKDRLGELRHEFERQLAQQKEEYEGRSIKTLDTNIEDHGDIRQNIEGASPYYTIADADLVSNVQEVLRRLLDASDTHLQWNDETAIRLVDGLDELNGMMQIISEELVQKRSSTQEFSKECTQDMETMGVQHEIEPHASVQKEDERFQIYQEECERVMASLLEIHEAEIIKAVTETMDRFREGNQKEEFAEEEPHDSVLPDDAEEQDHEDERTIFTDESVLER
eukprot:TRINITY_DN53534_c0_g1_i1.p1 TRINITY_DN53534_c0_g1~~TRINITY_DN53534_c0_g1_i1.p1  ORF type:complete len:626 (+),score=183.45 TRINITY_DN53534_c0_g1_i1:173-2050(+)